MGSAFSEAFVAWWITRPSLKAGMRRPEIGLAHNLMFVRMKEPRREVVAL
jgi:hypothetical protein